MVEGLDRSDNVSESEEQGATSLMSHPKAKLHDHGVSARALTEAAIQDPEGVITKTYKDEWPSSHAAGKPDKNVKAIDHRPPPHAPVASVDMIEHYEIVESDDEEPPTMDESSDDDDDEPMVMKSHRDDDEAKHNPPRSSPGVVRFTEKPTLPYKESYRQVQKLDLFAQIK